MIPSEIIEKIRDETNIADVVSQYVSLHKSGRNLFGLCPFHEEKTPSFSVNEQKQIFHCFSCGKGGNVFKFLMELQDLSYPEAINKVAEMQGIELDSKYNNTHNKKQVNSGEQHLFDIHIESTNLYHHILMNTEMGQPALDYLHNRGLTDKTIDKYQLGFAPQNSILKTFLSQKDFQYQDLRKSGLFIEDDDGTLKDRFFNRIMYPITNNLGKVVAFSGRVLHKDANQAKYLNSPETKVFNKSKVLFNFSNARNIIRKEKVAILYEGFMDVISAYQSGIKNGIASMGTSLTDDQIYLLQRTTSKLYICYDGDAPGQNAISRALKLLEPTNLKLGVIQMPSGIDPDEYRKQNGEHKFKDYMSSALETPISFKMRFLKLNRNLDNENDKISYINDVLKAISNIDEPIERDVYLNDLSGQFNLNKMDLTNQVNKLISRSSLGRKTSNYNNQSNNNLSISSITMDNVKPIGKIEMAEKSLLNRVLNNHEMWLRLMSKDGFCFVNDKYQLIYILAQAYFKDHDEYRANVFQDFVKEDDLQQLLINIDVMDLSGEATNSEIDDYVNIIMNEAPIEKQLKNKQVELDEAKKTGDIDRQIDITTDIINLQRKRQLNN
ncbi:DNA primase [Apilactobacillus apisilvae]|uniref:DNA primase n=1 Tax=Apilactobacillus apisilvae TaxID=2923364 RepID=A0ABY4PI38_9LACO|nr:DNA primase [Apilactobacillus apisilvae]UQS85439.1 DNA primase [Apilactobacillus apisilvae]